MERDVNYALYWKTNQNIKYWYSEWFFSNRYIRQSLFSNLKRTHLKWIISFWILFCVKNIASNFWNLWLIAFDESWIKCSSTYLLQTADKELYKIKKNIIKLMERTTQWTTNNSLACSWNFSRFFGWYSRWKIEQVEIDCILSIMQKDRLRVCTFCFHEIQFIHCILNVS